MAVILGTEGYVLLQRRGAEESIRATVKPGDVSEKRDSFVLEFDDADRESPFLTGDRVRLDSADGQPLRWIGPTVQGGVWYINVDELGALRLYPTFKEAVAGEDRGLVRLTAITSASLVRCALELDYSRPVGQMSSYELNTNRDAVDTTVLGDTFRTQYSTLISGSGRLSCFFDYEVKQCDPLAAAGDVEISLYYHQLLLRAQVGSRFRAMCVVVAKGNKPYSDTSDHDDMVFYDFEALVTNVGIAVSPAAPLVSTIEFVTTGPIRLRVETRSTLDRLLQEDGASAIRLEEPNAGVLLH